MAAGDPRIFLWTEACATIEQAERLRRQFFQPHLASSLATVPTANWEPPVDLFENRSGLSIVAALPGVEPQDLAISLKAGVLYVAGVRRLPAARGDAIHPLPARSIRAVERMSLRQPEPAVLTHVGFPATRQHRE